MLTVLRNGNKVVADGSLSRVELKEYSAAKELFCPVCGGLVKYCHGNVIAPYFSHWSLTDCPGESEPETPEHVQGKLFLAEWLRKQDGITNVELEVYLPDIKRQPDIMFMRNGQRCVVEYQCSPTTEYKQRRADYKAAGIQDFWILGVQKNKTVQEKATKQIVYGGGCQATEQGTIKSLLPQRLRSLLAQECAGFYDVEQQCFIVRGATYFNVLPRQRVFPNPFIYVSPQKTVLGKNALYCKEVLDALRAADERANPKGSGFSLAYYLTTERPLGWHLEKWYRYKYKHPVFVLKNGSYKIAVFWDKQRYQLAYKSPYGKWRQLANCNAAGDRVTAGFLVALLNATNKLNGHGGSNDR